MDEGEHQLSSQNKQCDHAEPMETSVCICIATYRRSAELTRLLRSLSTLALRKSGRVSVRIAIADNDPDGSSLSTVRDAASYLKIPILYEIEPSSGVSFARNQTVRMAGKCDFVAFVDDDEFVEPQWLDELLSTQALYNADVVLGPVLPAFDYEPPPWMVKGRFFERPRHATGTSLHYGRTGNALVTKRVLDGIRGPFDPSFALCGGEDTLLFKQLLVAGARIVWCDEAIVTEVNSAGRNARWFLRRAFGSANTHDFSQQALGMSLPRWLLALKGLALSAGGALALVPSPVLGFDKTVWACARVARGLGHLTAALNLRYKRYGASA
jgi:succinoglycan biosynthesis protein ExoM